MKHIKQHALAIGLGLALALAGVARAAEETIATAEVDVISSDKVSFLNEYGGFRNPLAEVRSVRSKLSDVISVKDYGAVGDGETDDTLAFSKTIAVAINNGKAIYVPGGRYKITKGLVLRPAKPSSLYPDHAGVSSVMFGDGPYASIIEWGGTEPMTENRWAMLNVAGRTLLRDIAFVCPRRYRHQTFLSPEEKARYEQVRTPYYGCVISGTAWNSTFINVQFKNFHVPLSMGVVKTVRRGPGIVADYEPAPGTDRPGTTTAYLREDIAQNTFINCMFAAGTDEWRAPNPVFDPDTTLNAHGTLLFKGSGDTNPVNKADFSDGTFAVEIGAGQSVNNNFVGCTIVNQNPASLGLIRLTSGCDTDFIGCGLFAGEDPRFPKDVPSGRPAFFENSAGQGTATRVSHCYFIGGLVHSSGSASSFMTIKDSSGEGGVRALCNFIDGVNGRPYDQQLILDNFSFGKFGPGGLRPLVLRNEAKGALATSWGITSSRPRLQIRNLLNPGPLVINGSTWVNVPGKAISVIPDLAASLRNSPNQPEDLPAYVYDPASPRSGWTSRGIRSGRWFFIADSGNANIIRPIFPIDPQSVYNISLDIWVKFQSGKGPQDLTNELAIGVIWRDAAGPIGQQVLPQFFGMDPANFRLGRVREGVTTHIANQVSPPINATSFELVIESNLTSTTVIDEIGVGGFKVWDTINEDCDLLTVNP
jgi:hypothetical protein